MRLTYDMSSMMWTALMQGKDTEGYEVTDPVSGKPKWVNTAAYGYEKAVGWMLMAIDHHNVAPVDCVMVYEGLNAKARRLMINGKYKSKGRDRVPQQYDEFNKLKDLMLETWRSLGAISMWQDNVEGDDVIAYIAQNTHEDLVVVTFDNDLAVLSGVNQHGAKITTRIHGEYDHNKYGMFPNKYISLYKSMVGDAGDTISGIKGFGEGAWIKFHAEFGERGMAEMQRLAELGSLNELEDEARQHKLIGQLWEGRHDFLNSWKLAKLHPEWVDTMADAIQWMPGVSSYRGNDERLVRWRAYQTLVTAPLWERFFDAFKRVALERDHISFDIETSTPDESDEWLAAQENPDGVDTIGSELTGFSITYGKNMQHTVYVSVDHAETENVTKAQVFELLQWIAEQGLRVKIHNTLFEGPVLYNEFGKLWPDNGYQGFIPNWDDTKIEASYVDENNSLGLKKLSKRWLNYEQVDYKTVTTIDGIPHKMRELTAAHVKSYGCDDTIVTAALDNFFRFVMDLEGTWEIYRKVEIPASYLHAQSYVHGAPVSIQRCKELEAEDDGVHNEAWGVLRNYLIKKGWAGTTTPVYTSDLTPAQVKEIYLIVTGSELETMVRKPARLLEEVRKGDELLAALLERAYQGDPTELNTLIARRFNGEPVFNMGSQKQMQSLMYETMGLPIKVFNKPTVQMKAAGIRQGTPKTDNLAISYALLDTTDEEVKEVLLAIRVLKMVQTRRSLYYKTYPYFVHWKTGRVHASHNQCATNTRRASFSSPNVQQVSKNEKVEGYSPKVREVYVPHKPGAVIVSMDFKAQELRVIAEWSRDENMLGCYIGDNKKDMHALTGLGIFNSRNSLSWDYDTYFATLEDKAAEWYPQAKKTRALGKQTNFTTEFGAAAPKLAQTLMVTEEEAQVYIDAKEAAFPGVRVWKDSVIAEAKAKGYVTTLLGARRHLREALLSMDRYTASKAERQAVNFKVQSSSAEMTKLAEGRMWDAELEQRFDAEIYFPIHDEIVASCVIEDLYEFIPAMHACMVGNYANMYVPIESSISFGWNFGPAHQIEIGDQPTRKAIECGLEELMKEPA